MVAVISSSEGYVISVYFNVVHECDHHIGALYSSQSNDNYLYTAGWLLLDTVSYTYKVRSSGST